MNRLITLAFNDFRNIIRDSILKYFFFLVPLLFILIFLFVLPIIINTFPIVNDYTDLILSFFCLEIPMIIGFVISFIMLDEKDEKVFTALRVMPVSISQFLFYRLFFAVFFTFIFIFAMLLLNNLFEMSMLNMILFSFLYALITPIVILLEVSFASNKVTGFTIFKGLNSFFMIPVASYFIAAKWEILIGIIPSYWPLNILYNFLKGDINFSHVIFSISYSLVVIFALTLIFKRRVFRI